MYIILSILPTIVIVAKSCSETVLRNRYRKIYFRVIQITPCLCMVHDVPLLCDSCRHIRIV